MNYQTMLLNQRELGRVHAMVMSRISFVPAILVTGRVPVFYTCCNCGLAFSALLTLSGISLEMGFSYHFVVTVVLLPRYRCLLNYG